MDRLFENRRQERIVKILKMIKEGKIVNRNTIGDLGVGDTAISRDFERFKKYATVSSKHRYFKSAASALTG